MRKILLTLTTSAALLVLGVAGVLGSSTAYAAPSCWAPNLFPTGNGGQAAAQYVITDCKYADQKVVNAGSNNCYLMLAYGTVPTDCSVLGAGTASRPSDPVVINSAKCYEQKDPTVDPVSGGELKRYQSVVCQAYADRYTGMTINNDKNCYVLPAPLPAPGETKPATLANCQEIILDSLKALTADAVTNQNAANAAAGAQWQADDLSDVTAKGGDLTQNPIYKTLLMILNFLSAGVFIVVAGVIVSAGIQYSAARENPQIVSAAKLRIWNAVLAALIYIFMYGILQWLVPGGIFSP